MGKMILIAVLLIRSFIAPLCVCAQGTLYVSNLGQTSTSGMPVGSDSWIPVMAYPASIGAYFRKCQHGLMSANMPPFSMFDSSKPPFNEHDTYVGGDSGRPDMIPMPDGWLVFVGGRSTSGPSCQMQTDMDVLSQSQGLNPADYSLKWYPSFSNLCDE